MTTVVVLVAGTGVTTVDRVTVVVVAGTGVTASSCSHAPKALTLTAKSASLPMPIRFFMYPVRVRRHMRLQIANASQSSMRREARETTDPKAVVSETAKDAVPIPIVIDRNLKQRLQKFTT